MKVYYFALLALVCACHPLQNPRAALAADPSRITALWANDGADKVTRQELRASSGQSVANRLWDGRTIRIFGARNEVVNFNLVLEAAGERATRVRYVFSELVGPHGTAIRSRAAELPAAAKKEGVFDWTSRPIENFYVRYLKIKGLSLLSYEHYDERHIPSRLQRPWVEDGKGRGKWEDRPGHDQEFPDIAVPLELVPEFEIEAGHSQSVWSDIYIPRDAAPGVYLGQAQVLERDLPPRVVPVELTVRPFTLPETPASQTMLYLGNDLNLRYTGVAWPDRNTPAGAKARLVRDRHFQLAHRHKLSLIDGDSGVTALVADQPSAEWLPRLSGELFTPAHGYEGPGAAVGNAVYAIGAYGSWHWRANGTEQDMWTHSDAWERWFREHAPRTERFLYLIDESADYPQIERWASWINRNPGVGRELRSFATIPLPVALAQTPSLDIAASWFTVGDAEQWTQAFARHTSTPDKRYFQYNGKRPSQGSFATEDDGVALRELAWAQYKKGIQRWMFWESTYYNDAQGGRGQTDLFENATTFSGYGLSRDPVLGETAWNHSNGDGVLFYPGTDTFYPASNYDLAGPIASLRLKHWRRGVQDIDYVTLASALDARATRAIVERMVPKAMWDYGIAEAADPTYVRADISWSIRPDDWERAREELAQIIESPSSREEPRRP